MYGQVDVNPVIAVAEGVYGACWDAQQRTRS